MKKPERRRRKMVSILPSVVDKGNKLAKRLKKRSFSHMVEDVVLEKYDQNLLDQKVKGDRL